MNKNDILEIWEYNRWAGARLLKSLESMEQEDFEKDLHSSHGGIRGTLLHMISAENIWLQRLAGGSALLLDQSRMTTLDDLKNYWDELEKGMSVLLGSMTDDQLIAQFEYQDTKGNKYSQPRVWALQQVFNHFTYHRGQIASMQRQLGYVPSNTDLIGFYRQKEARTVS